MCGDYFMNERLLELRKKLGLSQAQFGAKLNVRSNTITNYEKGYRSINDRTVADICREFNVSEAWLRDGKGPMFRPPKGIDNIIAEQAAKHIKSDSIPAKVIIAELASLSPEELESVYNFWVNVVKKVAAEIEKEQNK